MLPLLNHLTKGLIVYILIHLMVHLSDHRITHRLNCPLCTQKQKCPEKPRYEASITYSRRYYGVKKIGYIAETSGWQPGLGGDSNGLPNDFKQFDHRNVPR
jgi:hypothetical protein